MIPERSLPLFWGHIRKHDGDFCWEWKGSTQRGGYGHFCYSVNGKRHDVTATRVVWEFFHGAIPDNLYVLHRCDNPPCCNPRHLFLGTHGDNIRDMHSKGRAAITRLSGVNNPAAKLSPSQVARIRGELSDTNGVILARMFGVSRSTISKIKRGLVWV